MKEVTELTNISDKIIDSTKNAGVLGSTIISRNGDIIRAELPSGVHRETFSIMMATIQGAAQTVNNDLEMGTTNSIVIDSNRGKLIIIGTGKNEFVAMITDHTFDVSEFVERIKELKSALQ